MRLQAQKTFSGLLNFCHFQMPLLIYRTSSFDLVPALRTQPTTSSTTHSLVSKWLRAFNILVPFVCIPSAVGSVPPLRKVAGLIGRVLILQSLSSHPRTLVYANSVN